MRKNRKEGEESEHEHFSRIFLRLEGKGRTMHTSRKRGVRRRGDESTRRLTFPFVEIEWKPLIIHARGPTGDDSQPCTGDGEGEVVCAESDLVSQGVGDFVG